MEGNLSQGFMEGLDLRANHLHHNHNQHHHHHHHASIQENFPLTIATEYNNNNNNKGESEDEEDERSLTEDGAGSRGKKGSSLWQRVKWTDTMVRLLITAVSYMGDESGPESGKRKQSVQQKKGKWKSVSRVMSERGHHVSPQQCEDKFNDLNKRYKRLNDMLGRGTSCQVVETPSLLELIDYLSEKEKDDVRKILSSKHLFYEEMCSYHNGNRLHLPHDPALQHSLHLHRDDAGDPDDHHDLDLLADSGKRFRPSLPHPTAVQSHWLESCSLQLEERKLQIQAETLELENHRLKWERFCKKRDRELDKLRIENERMKLENERMALDLKRKEMGAGL